MFTLERDDRERGGDEKRRDVTKGDEIFPVTPKSLAGRRTQVSGRHLLTCDRAGAGSQHCKTRRRGRRKKTTLTEKRKKT